MDTPEYELGPKLHTYGLNYFELLRWLVILVPIALVIGSVIDPRAPVAVIALTIIVFLLVMLYQEIFPRRLIIYEKGIVSQVNKQLRGWRWDQLTQMTGTRHTYYVNGIPLFRYGENTFIAGGISAFDVTWWTADPNRVVQYIFMKMAEREVPAFLQAFQEGRALGFGPLYMDRNRVGNQRTSYIWSDIEKYRWKGKSLAIVSRSQGREIPLGSVEPPELYFMMAVMDNVHGTQVYPTYQMNHLKGPVRWLGIERRAILLIAGIIGIGALLIGAVNSATSFNQWQQEQGRNELAARYGQESFNICVTAHDKNNKGATLKEEHKYIVVNTDQGVNINATFQGGLNKSDVAESKTDLTAIICLKQQNIEVEACPYGGNEQKAKFYISRYQSIYLVSIVDIQTGKTFASTVIAGEMPNDCPDKIKSSEARDIYGPQPIPGKLANFLERVKSSPSPENSA